MKLVIEDLTVNQNLIGGLGREECIKCKLCKFECGSISYDEYKNAQFHQLPPWIAHWEKEHPFEYSILRNKN